MTGHCEVCQQPTAGTDLCGQHRSQLGGWLHTVPLLAAELLDRRRGLSRNGGLGGSGDEHPIPWDEGAAAVLADFEARVRLACHAGATETASCAALRAHATWRTFGDASTWRAMAEAVGRAEDFLTPPARWYAGVCSAPVLDDWGSVTECSRDLYARGTTGHIRCPSCGTKHDVAERRAVLVDRADDQLVTLREFVTAAPELLRSDVRLDRVQKWATRGLVTNRGARQREYLDPRTGTLHLRSVLVYRFGDLRACATRRPAGTLS